jgi:hypothetical protein
MAFANGMEAAQAEIQTDPLPTIDLGAILMH